MKEDNELHDVIRSVYGKHANRASLNPTWLATEAMVEIEFPRGLHPTGYIGCHLYCRQIAREFCRNKFDPIETKEDDLFPETLQGRYPKRPMARGEEPEYVLRDFMSKEDVVYNVSRLRKEASAKLAHADALEAWGRQRDISAA